MKCYLIEDDSATQFVISMKLRKLGFDTQVFGDVASFESTILTNPSDLSNSLLLIDINLPNEDGDQFAIRQKSVLETIEGLKMVFMQDSTVVPKEIEDCKDVYTCSKSELTTFVEKLYQ